MERSNWRLEVVIGLVVLVGVLVVGGQGLAAQVGVSPISPVETPTVRGVPTGFTPTATAAVATVEPTRKPGKDESVAVATATVVLLPATGAELVPTLPTRMPDIWLEPVLMGRGWLPVVMR